MVVALKLGVVKEVAVESAVPPVEALYQATVPPAGAVAVSVRVPVPHLVAPVAAGAAGMAFTVAMTAVLVADAHPVVLLTASA